MFTSSLIPVEMNRRDMRLLKEMGANFVRISHYPQDPEIYRACDELGLIVWSEICVVNEVRKNAEFAHNCKEMLKEMILQNYNHPSKAVTVHKPSLIVSNVGAE